MLLKCTNGLMAWLHHEYQKPCAVYDDLYAWGATSIQGEGHDYHLLLRNSATGLALLFDLSDGERFPIISEERVKGFLERGLGELGFDSDDVAFYLKEGEQCTFTKRFESAYERKKLKDLSAWVLERGLDEAKESISSLPVTIDRRKVDAKALFGELLKERRREVTRKLYPVVSVKVRLLLSPEYNVWRRFLLPLDLTYGGLHDIIQVAFGWDGSHLHEFRLGTKLHIMPAIGLANDFRWGGAELLDEDEETLAEVKMKRMTYIYDFGDHWTHEITLGKVFTAEEEQKPVCVGGEGSAPWEDCGGVWGYVSIMKSLKDPDNPNYRYARSWARLGYWDGSEGEGDYDDDDAEGEGNDGTPFDQGHINARLKAMF